MLSIRRYGGDFEEVDDIELGVHDAPKRRKWTCINYKLVSLLLVLTLVIFLSLYIECKVSYSSDTNYVPIITSDDAWQQKYQSTSKQGMVAADDYRCSKIGAAVLTDGGYAADAAIATALCLGVVSPASSGLGGGAFILTYNGSSHEATFIDSREIAPAAASKHMYDSNPSSSVVGGLAIAIPVEAKGLYLAYQTHGGGVSWSRIVAPSIELARSWRISTTVANYIALIEESLRSGQCDELAKHYIDSKGKLKQAGDLISNSALANTLTGISNHGPDYLYNTMADVLASEIADAGGIIEAAEIRTHEPKFIPPLISRAFGYIMYGSPPPSSGGLTVLAILKFLSGYEEPLASQSGLYDHHLVEAMKHAFAIRMNLGDPDFVNTSAIVEDVLSGSIMSDLRHATKDNSVLPVEQYGRKYSTLTTTNDDHGTSHISVLDKHGNAVAITTTINTYFGSCVMSPSTGIVFNNQMDDFSKPNASNFFGLAPFESNYIEPGKTPLSSMSPTILVNAITNRTRLVGGASGGPRIITATAQVILNYIARGMTLLESVIAPRVHSQLLPTVVYIENRKVDTDASIKISVDTVAALHKRGHVMEDTTSTGVSQFIEIDPDTLIMTGISDPRKNGMPAPAQ